MMPPEKMAEIGHAMSHALAAAIAADPNNNVAVHHALWDAQLARIAELEAAIVAITYESDGGVYPAQRDHVDLVPIAPILLDVHRRRNVEAS